jgi:hypothetical protein
MILVFSSCKKEPGVSDYKLPVLKNPSELILKDKLELPGGLSRNLSLVKGGMLTRGATMSGAFIEGPLYRNFYSLGGIKKYKNPKIQMFSGSVENMSGGFTITPLAEFDLGIYPADFGSYFYSCADSLWRSIGLSLVSLIMKSGEIIATSNYTDKIFKINNSGTIEVYLQDSELKRITDLLQTRDGTLYAVQTPLMNNTNSAIVSPKRVISIKNKTIKTEFELPTDLRYSEIINQGGTGWWDYNYTGPVLERLKIIENSDAGKKRFGTKFYISDLLKRTIYKVDNKNNISSLATGLTYPTSIAVDSLGDVFYTTSILDNYSTSINIIEVPAAIYVINPETGISTKLYEFGKDVRQEYMAAQYGGYYIEVKLGSTPTDRYIIPIGFNVSNILFETATKIGLLITNSHQGTLKAITFDK